jgi:endonuclease/exonuclease/phosphatase family metal-dependent hydrolase
MNRRRMVFCSWQFLIAISCGVLLAEDDLPTRQLRVMTYNIHHGEGTDGRIDLERIAKVIRDAKPDLVALQEVDKNVKRSGEVDQTSELARLTQMHGRFGKQIPYEGGDYGQAVLSRFAVSELTVHWLPGEPERQRRIAVAGDVDFGARKVVFASTHLHHNNVEFREQQATALNDLFRDSEQPVILAGDLNAYPDSRAIEILGHHWSNTAVKTANCFTFPAVGPKHQIDYILYQPRRSQLISRKAVVIDESLASDHRPLVVEFTISDSDN